MANSSVPVSSVPVSLVPAPLPIPEAPAVWAAFQRELPVVIIGAIRGMGLARARRRVAGGVHDSFGNGPGAGSVRGALIADIDLHHSIREAVWVAFMRAVTAQRVWRSNAKGWLNTATVRTTHRLATKRAAQLFAEVQPNVGELDPIARLPDETPLADELLDTARLRAVLARICAELSELDRALLRLGDDAPTYADLAARFGVSPDRLRVRAFRLRTRLRTRIIEEVGDDEIAAE